MWDTYQYCNILQISQYDIAMLVYQYYFNYVSSNLAMLAVCLHTCLIDCLSLIVNNAMEWQLVLQHEVRSIILPCN